MSDNAEHFSVETFFFSNFHDQLAYASWIIVDSQTRWFIDNQLNGEFCSKLGDTELIIFLFVFFISEKKKWQNKGLWSLG